MSRLTEGLIWASVGAGLGYLLTRRNLEIEFQKRLNLQIDSAEDFYRRKYEKKLKEEREKDLGETKETIKSLVEESPLDEAKEMVESLRKGVEEVEEVYRKQAGVIIEEAGLTSTLVNYQGMFQGETELSERVSVERVKTTDQEEAPEEPPHPSKNPDKLPVMISGEAYFENHSGFKQVSRMYYAGDDILATEENRIVSEGARRSELGNDILEKLKMGLDGNAETLYVRNEKSGTEYEIFRDPEAYVDAVGPIGSVG